MEKLKVSIHSCLLEDSTTSSEPVIVILISEIENYCNFCLTRLSFSQANFVKQKLQEFSIFKKKMTGSEEVGESSNKHKRIETSNFSNKTPKTSGLDLGSQPHSSPFSKWTKQMNDIDAKEEKSSDSSNQGNTMFINFDCLNRDQTLILLQKINAWGFQKK